MAARKRLRAIVQPGHRVEISLPDLAVGTQVDVTVEDASSGESLNVLDVLRAAPGHVIFQTAEEVDRYLRSERDAWDR